MIDSLLMELSDFKEMLESDAQRSNIAKNYYEDFLPIYDKIDAILGAMII